MPSQLDFNTDLRDLLFADWSDAAIYRTIQPQYDPQHGVLVELTTDHPLLVISSPVRSSATPNTAQQHSADEQSWLIRPSELPPDAAPRGDHLIHAGREHLIIGIDQSTLSGLITLHTRSLPDRTPCDSISTLTTGPHRRSASDCGG
ncbi:MAG: hypothetical protein R3B90_05595 [Planctomycetaceae bacterium]